MSTQHFTPEFKEEAAKQVTEHGYSAMPPILSSSRLPPALHADGGMAQDVI
ncbi:hypothetical protein [Vogesella urethralis]|uniref:hypothetical protein n=1 Tax=Vogesella urethralis TaxID=2592656 RepID=UPI00197D3194|nr:hypothetical protein [Vogesella urethralis]